MKHTSSHFLIRQKSCLVIVSVSAAARRGGERVSERLPHREAYVRVLGECRNGRKRHKTEL